MRATDFVMVLPAIYVALALRSVLPLVLTPPQVFALLAAIFAVVGAPFVARGVRAIVRIERRLDYAAAAQALGASDARCSSATCCRRRAASSRSQITLLVPAFIVAEATLSYVGLGFPDPVASWGTMLHDASRTSASSPISVAAQPRGGDVSRRLRTGARTSALQRPATGEAPAY